MLRYKNKLLPILTAIIMATCVWAGYRVYWGYFAPARMVVMDIGQGDAILFQEGSKTLLIDAGPPGMVVDALRRNHVTHLDAVVVTHMHADHFSGVCDMPGSIEVDALYVAEGATPYVPANFTQASSDLGCPIQELHAGDKLRLNNFELEMIWPTGPTKGDANADSVCMFATYAKDDASMRVFLTGDAERDEIRQALKPYVDPRVDILKVGHHGSAMAIYPEEASQLAPRVSIASCGKENDYGHPTSECIEVLTSCGSTFIATSASGDIACYPTSSGIEIVTQYRVAA